MNDDLVEDFLHELEGWERAYPLSMFPEPDLAKAAELLKAGGMTLDAISASNMRHVVSQIAPKARAAISAVEGEGWQPIDSAPKDGMPKLVTAPDWAWPRMAHERALGGWHDNTSGIACVPTHWRPLPPPPVSKGEKM